MRLLGDITSKPEKRSDLTTSHLKTSFMPKEDKKTKSFVLRIDSDTMDAIERWAADEFRSTNGQLQWIINEALRKRKRKP